MRARIARKGGCMATDKRALLFVAPRRRDGKYAVEFVFPITGRRSRRVLTVDQLRVYLAGDKYSVGGAGGRELCERLERIERDWAQVIA